MPGFEILGTLTTAIPYVNWAFAKANELGPTVQNLISSAEGVISRVGDVVVWQSEGGKQLLFGLESMGDQVSRVEGAVAGIETSQLAMQGTLGVVQTVSMATLGITSLSAGFMVLRLNSLNKRFDNLSKKINDLEGQIEAANKAHLKSSLQYLCDYEKKQRDGDLDNACDEARRASNIYGQLSEDESKSQKRLPVLNYRGRCFLLSFLTELECLILRDDQSSALERIAQEKPRLELLASVVFAETVAKSPEAYLDPNMKSAGVTLDLMTEVYQQSRHAGAISDIEIQNANQMFEHVRERIYRPRPRWLWRPAGAVKRRYAQRLKYLMACVEDVNRVEALKLLLAEAEAKSLNLRDVSDRMKNWRLERRPETPVESNEVLAYSIT